MNYKILITIFFIFITSCVNPNINKKKVIEPIIVQKYSNSGFTLIYTEELFVDRIVNKKLNDRDLFIFQMLAVMIFVCVRMMEVAYI